MNAVRVGLAGIAERLLAIGPVDKGVDLSESLCFATENGNERVVKLLLAAEVSLNAYDHRERSALALAAEGKHIGTMNLLLEAGVDVNCKDEGSWTPLMRVAMGGCEEGVTLLLEVDGIDLNTKNARQESALSLAVLFGYNKTVRLLRVLGGTNV